MLRVCLEGRRVRARVHNPHLPRKPSVKYIDRAQPVTDELLALEAAALDVESAAELLGLATAAAFGKWRDDQSVMLTKTRQVTAQSTRDVPLFLDGERVNVGKKRKSVLSLKR